MNVFQSLQAINLYPIPQASVEAIAIECGLDISADMDASVAASKPYKRAKAKVYLFLSEAPNVSEAGASYSFNETERRAFARTAANLLAEIGEDESSEVECGYFGEDF